jgi:hypothetical protein
MEADPPVADAASPLADTASDDHPEWMQPPAVRRSWTIPIIAGAIALVFVALLCVAGAAAGFLALRSPSGPAPATAPETVATPSVSPSPSAVPSPSPLSPAACLIGDWIEKTGTTSAKIFGVTVQLTGGGATHRFTGAGETVLNVSNVVLSGNANGDHYEVIHDGSITMNYQATETTIYYSNPRAVGATSWKINGRTRESEPIRASLKPETYICKGDDLRLYTDGGGAAELTRVAG